MPRKTWREALAAYSSPSTLVLLLLGFAAGLPYMLVFSTLSVWLREAGVARETIGYASLIRSAWRSLCAGPSLLLLPASSVGM